MGFLEDWQLWIGLILAGIVLLVIGYYYLQFWFFKSKVDTGKDLIGVKDIPYVPIFAPNRNKAQAPKTSFLKNIGSKVVNNPIVRDQAKKVGKKAGERGFEEAKRRAQNNPKARGLLDKTRGLNAPSMEDLRTKRISEIKTELKSSDRDDLRDIALMLDIQTSGSKTQLRNRIVREIQRDQNKTPPGSNTTNIKGLGNLSNLSVEKTNVEYAPDGSIQKARVYLKSPFNFLMNKAPNWKSTNKGMPINSITEASDLKKRFQKAYPDYEFDIRKGKSGYYIYNRTLDAPEQV